MLFNSYPFLFLFLPVVWFGFQKLRNAGRFDQSILWLVFASLFFYGWWNPIYLFLLIGSVIFNFGLGTLFTLFASRSKAQRRSLLVLGVSVNLGLLGYFKYANFFIDTANRLLNSDTALPSIILPLAISFFTFQQIAYLVDRYHNRIPDHHFLHFTLYVIFFPQLIAGPIVRPGEILSQYSDRSRRGVLPENISVGLTLFIIGLFKKVVLADHLALFATPVFALAQEGLVPTASHAWMGSLAYTFQLYFDFSGYSDMALGLAHLFGFRLPLNFNSPYKANSIIEFWRRWHITLSRFMLDYLYIPLGGNKSGPARRNVNLMITMLLGGLWHGAQWTFVAWGAFHGLLLAINHSWQILSNRWNVPRTSLSYRALARSLTFLMLVLAWVLFRAESFSAALRVYQGMLGMSGNAADIDLDKGLAWILAGWTICWALPNAMQWLSKYPPALQELKADKTADRFLWQPNLVWSLTLLLLAVVCLLQMTSVSEFLYFQF